MGASGKQIYQWLVEQKLDTDGLTHSNDKAKEVVDHYKDLNKRIKDVATKMEQHWQGKAAGAANRGVGPIAVAFSTMSEGLNDAQDSTSQQVEGFNKASSSVKEIPDEPPEPNGMTKVTSLGTDPGSGTAAAKAQGEIDDYDKAHSAHQAANAHNVHIYKNFSGTTKTNVGNLPDQYGPKQKEHLNASVEPASLGQSGGNGSSRTPPSGSGAGGGRDTTGGGGQTGAHGFNSQP